VLSAVQIKSFTSLIKNHKKFVISGHHGPDGDVIGSTLGLVLGLKQLGKTVLAFNPDGCPQWLSFLPKSEIIKVKIPNTFKNSILITVDSGDLGRLGNKIDKSFFSEIWNIDHHQSNTRFGKYNFIDVKAGSTGQVVFNLLSGFSKFKITPAIAQNLFCTLSTDTGSFRYSNATSDVFALAALLVKAGAQPDVISQSLYETYTQRRLKLMHRVLGSLKFENDGKLAKLYLTQDDLAAVGAGEDESENFVNLPRGVEGVKIVCFLSEKTSTEWKLSLRARGNTNVLNIATEFGGGGHKLAAGCTIHGVRAQVEKQLDSVLKTQGHL